MRAKLDGYGAIAGLTCGLIMGLRGPVLTRKKHNQYRFIMFYFTTHPTAQLAPKQEG